MSEKKTNMKGVALKAGFWYAFSNIMVKAITFITTPVFTKLLTTAQYGEVQTFMSWHSLLLPLYTLNLTYSVGRAKLDFPDQLEQYIGSMQLLSACVSAVTSVLALIFLKPVSGLLELSAFGTVLLIVYLFFGPTINMYQAGYRFRYQYRQNIAIAWIIALGTTLLSLLLILTVDADRAELRMLGIVIPTVALASVFWAKSLKNRCVRVNGTYWRYALKISVPMILHTVCMHILSQSDRVFITKIWGKDQTGLYSLAYTYGMLLHILTSAVSESWLPWFHDTYFAGNHAEIRKNVKPLILLGCYIGLACIAFAPEAVLVLGGEKYAEAVWCVPPIVLGVVCQFIYTHYVNIELHLKKTGYVSGGTIFAAGLNLLLNWIFIPVYGYVAAAYTTLAGYMALLIIHAFITHRVLKVKLYNDLFMFGAMAVTALLTVLLAFLYDRRLIRYAVIAAGFVSFLYVFRGFITGWRKKLRQKRARAAGRKANAKETPDTGTDAAAAETEKEKEKEPERSGLNEENV